MDIGATLNLLFTYPVSDESQFMQAKSEFDHYLLKSSEIERRQIFKYLRFLTNEDFMAKSLIIKYRLFLSKLLTNSILEAPPKLPPFYLPQKSTDLNLEISGPDEVSRSKIFLVKLAELIYKYKVTHLILELKIAVHRSKHVKKAMKLAKTKIRVREFFKFSVGLFKNHTYKLRRIQELNDIFALKELAKHGRIFRRNQKFKAIVGIFFEQKKRIFWELSIKKAPLSVETPRKTVGSVSELMKSPNTPNSYRRSLQGTPYTPKKSPHRDLLCEALIDFAYRMYSSNKESMISSLKEVLPKLKNPVSLTRIYERMTVYFKKLMFIQFVHHIEKKLKTQKILDTLLIAQIIKHSHLFKKKSKLEMLSKLLRVNQGKVILARIWAANKFLNNVENKFIKFQKLHSKIFLRRSTKEIFKISKVCIGVRRLEKVRVYNIKQNFKVIFRHSKEIKETSEIFERLYIGKRKIKLNSLIAYGTQFKEFGKIWNFFDNFADIAIKKNISKGMKNLKKLSVRITILESKSILKLAVALGKLQASASQIIDENKEKMQKFDRVNEASTIIKNVIKKYSFNLLRTVKKYYKYEFTETKNLNTISKFGNKLPVSIKNQKAIETNPTSQGFQSFLQLFSIVNTSFTEQKSHFREVDQRCIQLETQLNKTSEILLETSKRTQLIDNEILQIRENKQKFLQSQITLDDLQRTMNNLDQEFQNLVKSTFESADKERLLDDQISEVLKTYGKVELSCKETEHEIKRVEQEYSLLRDKKNRYVNSPERFNRLGASFNSPDRRSPHRSPYQSPRKFTNTSSIYARGSPTSSPIRSRREETFPSFRDSIN